MGVGTLFLTVAHSSGLPGRTQTFLRYGISERFSVGAGYFHGNGTLRPLWSYRTLDETTTRPAVTVGMMTDALRGGHRTTYVALSKAFGPAQAYIAPGAVTGESRLRFFGGASVTLRGGTTLSAQYDGRYANLGISAPVGSYGGLPIRIGLIAARGSRVGPLMATSFPLGAP